MYTNLLHLPLFNFAYLFFLFFLSFPLNIFVSLIFIALYPNWHLGLVLFSSLCFSYFCSGRHNFWFPLFARSNYCPLYLLYCFYFAYGCICIYVYSVTLFIVVINLCLYIGPLQFCGVFPFFFLFFFLLPFLISFLFFIILIFLAYYIFIHLFLCLPFLLLFSPCS